jgi:hypothetical protein
MVYIFILVRHANAAACGEGNESGSWDMICHHMTRGLLNFGLFTWFEKIANTICDECLIDLLQESTVMAQKIASENAENRFKRPTNVVEFDDVMQTTKSATHTSESCLRELSCLPLGGYSVMSTFPAVNVSAPVVKPVVVAMASMDSATFFRDVAPGADSPMSGLTCISSV